MIHPIHEPAVVRTVRLGPEFPSILYPTSSREGGEPFSFHPRLLDLDI